MNNATVVIEKKLQDTEASLDRLGRRIDYQNAADPGLPDGLREKVAAFHELKRDFTELKRDVEKLNAEAKLVFDTSIEEIFSITGTKLDKQLEDKDTTTVAATMDVWLSSLQTQLASEVTSDLDLTIVMGNEACDLDSGVSSLSYAYHLATRDQGCDGKSDAVFTRLPERHVGRHLVVPVLPILKVDFPLKTELVHCLAKRGISQENLIFLNDIDLTSFKSFRVVLVDHNVRPEFQDKVCSVLDHHVKECNYNEEDVSIKIETVGSCSTLVAETIFSEAPDFNDPTVLGLIRETIILDTVGLSEQAKRVTPKDRAMLAKINEIIGDIDINALYDEVWEAKSSISHLTPHQLLRRDLKVVDNDKVKIAVPSVPMMVQNFIQLDNVNADLEKFGDEGNFAASIVLGINVSAGIVTRDLMIKTYPSRDPDGQVLEAIKRALVGEDDIDGQDDSSGDEEDKQTPPETQTNGSEFPSLHLILDENLGQQVGLFYHQGNPSCSRKQILPIIKSIF